MHDEKLKQALLTSHSIYLRVIEEEDVTNGFWHHWYNDYKLTAYNSHGVYPVNIQDELKYFKNAKNKSDEISLAVCSLVDDLIIGVVSLLNIDHLNCKAEIACTIGNNISPTAGIESIGLIIQHGMDRLNLNKIYGGAHAGLSEWVKMLGCLGFVEEGLLRQEFLRDRKYSDLIKFGLFADDYYQLVSDRKGEYLFESQGALYKNALSKLKKK